MILILIGIGSRKLNRIHSHIYNTVNSQIFPTHVSLIRTLWNLQYFPNPPLKPTHWLIVVNTLIAFNLLSLIAGTRDTSWHKIWINTSKTESRTERFCLDVLENPRIHCTHSPASKHIVLVSKKSKNVQKRPFIIQTYYYLKKTIKNNVFEPFFSASFCEEQHSPNF